MGDNTSGKVGIKKTSIQKQQADKGTYSELPCLQDDIAIPFVIPQLLLGPVWLKEFFAALFVDDVL